MFRLKITSLNYCKHSSEFLRTNSSRFGDILLQVECNLLFHWELVDCKLPFRGRRLRAQVCGVVNILQG
jgi:hypothetical protein